MMGMPTGGIPAPYESFMPDFEVPASAFLNELLDDDNVKLIAFGITIKHGEEAERDEVSLRLMVDPAVITRLHQIIHDARREGPAGA